MRMTCQEKRGDSAFSFDRKVIVLGVPWISVGRSGPSFEDNKGRQIWGKKLYYGQHGEKFGLLHQREDVEMTTRTDVGPMAREEISSLPVLPLTTTATRRSDRKGAASDPGELASASENAEKIPGEEEDDSGSIGPSSLVPPPLIIPLRYRLLAFSMIIFFATGSSFAENTLSPLKSTVRKELKVTNAQYGAIASASSLVNTILPIIGGIGMDHWGATQWVSETQTHHVHR